MAEDKPSRTTAPEPSKQASKEPEKVKKSLFGGLFGKKSKEPVQQTSPARQSSGTTLRVFECVYVIVCLNVCMLSCEI